MSLNTMAGRGICEDVTQWIIMGSNDVLPWS